MKRFAAGVSSLLILLSCSSNKPETVCVLQTNYGTMAFRFFEQEAPKACARFKAMADSGFYNGNEFYRVVSGHVIQAGQATEPIGAEFSTRKHLFGTVGIARSSDPNSGSSVFYICLAPRPHLDGKYTVIGQLVEGEDILRIIGGVEVEERYMGEVAFHKPKKPVLIERAYTETRMLAPWKEPAGQSGS